MSSTLLRKTQFFQSVLFITIVLDITYFVTSLTPGQRSPWVGQKEATNSKVFLPRRRSADFMCFCMNSPAASSASAKYGALQPPYLKPPAVSSTPPGACMTPSNVINSKTIIFLMVILLYEIAEYTF